MKAPEEDVAGGGVAMTPRGALLGWNGHVEAFIMGHMCVTAPKPHPPTAPGLERFAFGSSQGVLRRLCVGVELEKRKREVGPHEVLRNG